MRLLNQSIGVQIQAIEKAAANLPQSTQAAIFNINGGRVEVIQLLGEVTTVIQTQANATKLISNPTVGADVDLCGTNDITADAVGTIYSITNDFSDAMVATTSGAVEVTPTANSRNLIIAAGTIDLDCAASNTGQTKWVILYRPIDIGATVTSA
tara:strand:+ start:646 stop:1107 length:462 start_codon:yes stop_codon:yes gene_type:complete